MTRRFEDIAVGDQLELPAARGAFWHRNDGRDPERPVDVAIVTHRWHDPFEEKDYVALARILRDGTRGKPFEKRTIRGLAQAGWRPARRDWLTYARALTTGEVVPLKRPKS